MYWTWSGGFLVSADRLKASPDRFPPFLLVFFRRFKWIAACSFASGVVALAIALLLPKWYTARVGILPPHEAPRMSELVSEEPKGLQLRNLLPYTQGVTLLDVYMGILRSQRIGRALIDEFDLMSHYGVDKRIEALSALGKHTQIGVSTDRVIEVNVEDKNPEFAASLANAYAKELDTVLRETESTAGKRQRTFLERRTLEVRTELDSLETSLASAQRGQSIVALSNDLTEAAYAAGNLIGRRMALQVQLDMMQGMGMGEIPARREIEEELRALESEIGKLPELGMEMARRLRDVRIKEVVYEELTKQLELARIAEAKDMPVVEVLDVAVPPDRHSRPRRGLTALAGAFLGGIVSLGWFTYRDGSGTS